MRIDDGRRQHSAGVGRKSQWLQKSLRTADPGAFAERKRKMRSALGRASAIRTRSGDALWIGERTHAAFAPMHPAIVYVAGLRNFMHVEEGDYRDLHALAVATRFSRLAHA